MKVLMIAPQPFFQPRGTPFSVLHRLEALSALGHEVDLVTYPIGEDRAIERVKIFRSARVPGINSVKVGPSWKKFPLDTVLTAKVWSLFRKGRYDLIHTHEEGGYLGALLSRWTGTPHLYDMHSSLPQQLQNYGFLAHRPILWLARILERFVLRHSRGIITICESLRDIALSQGASKDRVFLLHNRPVDEKREISSAEREEFVRRIEKETQCPLSSGPLVLYTGTFEKNQGLELMVEAFAQVRQRFPSAILALVGGTPTQVEQLQQQAQTRGVSDVVLVLGRRPVEEMGLWMAAATVLLSPRTRGTNTPLKIYSYLQAGRAILATDLETHRQVLDEATSLLVPPTRAGLAEGLAQLLESGQLRESLARGAQDVARDRFSPELYLERHRRMIQQMSLVGEPGVLSPDSTDSGS